MAFPSMDALVLREVRYKEADRILTLFTSDRGIVTAKARGALRKSSRIAAATQVLTLSEMTFFENRGFMTVREASVKEAFSGLRERIEDLALGCYFSECVEALVPEGEREGSVFQLILNSLYALSHELRPPLIIKAAFEMRLMCLLGYQPDLTGCMICGREEPVSPLLGLETGHVCCKACRDASLGIAASLCSSSFAALRYIVTAPAKQLFSFQLEDEAMKRLSDCTEKYLIRQSGRHFPTLDYWKKIRI